MLPVSYRFNLRLLACVVLLYLFIGWANASVLLYHKRNERPLENGHVVRGEIETDETRFNRQTYNPWTTLNRTVTDKKTYCGQRLIRSMKDICRGGGRHNGELLNPKPIDEFVSSSCLFL
jgi:hypothetical protein